MTTPSRIVPLLIRSELEMGIIKSITKKLFWLRLALPVVVVVVALVIIILTAAPKAFAGIFTDAGAFATFFGAILATLGIPYGVWLSTSSESRRKKREAKADIANEMLSLVSMMDEVVENFRVQPIRDEAQGKRLIEQYNDLNLRLSESFHKARFILTPADLEPYEKHRVLIEKFALCKWAEGFNNSPQRGDKIYLPYPVLEYQGVISRNLTNDPFGDELSAARKQIEQVFKKYIE